MKVNRNPPVIKRNRPTIVFIQLNGLSTDGICGIRAKLYQEQKGLCAILKTPIPFDKLVLDHKHKLKGQKPGPRGRGLIRGLIDFRANSLEGIYLKKFKKSGLLGEIGFTDYLRALADYVDDPPCEQIYIHKNEKIKLPIFKKTEYNRIVKYYKEAFPRSKKIPPYPPSGIKKVGKKKKGQKQKYKYVARLTPKWQTLLDMVNKIRKGAK